MPRRIGTAAGSMGSAPTDVDAAATEDPAATGSGEPRRTRITARTLRAWATHPVARHVWLIAAYVALGLVVTWPRAAYLAGRLPNTRDQASYTFDLWWVAHQLTHLGNPFDTKMIYAPVGTPLAYNSMMPLLGVVMTPVTLLLGAAFSANLLSILVPGLAAYAMYRAARLWLPPTGAFASGALFGLSSMLTWRAWFHLNLAAGAVFIPITLEAAVRLRRAPSVARSVVLGLIVGSCLLVDTESTILCAIVVAVVLVPWLLSQPSRRKAALLALATLIGVAIALPELVAMLRQTYVLQQDPAQLARSDVVFGVSLTQIFAPSPRVAAFGLSGLGNYYFHGIKSEGMPTFGVTLTLLALFGVVVSWRRALARSWLILWVVGAVVALGPVLYIGTHPYTPVPLHDHGHTMSWIMPFTWLTRVPGLSGFYEANRFTVLALVPAALLAGYAVMWLRKRSVVALVIVALLAATELGWSGPQFGGSVPPLSLSARVPAGAAMAADLPAVDRAIKADHSGSLVVDVPLGFRSGTREYGAPFLPEALELQAQDEHPRAVGYVARLPKRTVDLLARHRFYTALLRLQRGGRVTRAVTRKARADARAMHVGWVVVWQHDTRRLRRFLAATGFRFAYRATGVSVYRG